VAGPPVAPPEAHHRATRAGRKVDIVVLAYLVLAHEHPAQLGRLVARIACEHAHVFIHVDAKAAIEPFRQAVGARPNVSFVQDRVRVEWAGYSIVEAILRTLRTAMKADFRYCLLISGADYPLKSNEDLLAFFSNANEEYITFWRLADRPSWMHKVQYHYWIDRIPMREWAAGTEPRYWRRLFWGRFFKYRRFMPKRRFLPGMVAYGGPDWWSLSRACAQYVLDFVDANPRYSRYYRSTASPGEMFFQTIVLNSRFGERVHNREAYMSWAAHDEAPATDRPMLPEDSFNLRYADWSGELTGEREKPAILDERDWHALTHTPCHFARKFHPDRSRALMDRIDRVLLERTT
jgi:hypothetical protein